MNTNENNQQNQQNGYQPQPEQQGYQQPNGYQQQPNGYQQQPNGYYQQPNGYYQPQPQVVVVQQAAPAPKATPAEKEAYFGPVSSIFMLIFCIVSTLNLVTSLIGNIISFDISGILLMVLDILIVIGLWIAYANAKKKNLTTKGISLVRVPYVIQFIFSCFTFVGELVISIITLNILGLLLDILSFVFTCICFSSVNKTLLLAADINKDLPVAGRKAGSFAAIVMIISASLTLIKEIVSYITLAALLAVVGSELPALEPLLNMLAGGGTMTIVSAVVTFIVSISAAIVILQFGKKVKEAHSMQA